MSDKEKQPLDPLIVALDPNRPLNLDETDKQYELLIDKMRREAEIYGSPTARTLQQAGDILGTVPPIGLPGMAAQTTGDALYTGASGYLASQNVPGATEETAGGLAALLSPLPRALISPEKRKLIRDALQELGLSQAAQETGKYLGKAEQEKALKSKP
jgi:hypothetical protein|tara:strand:- start:966 stop:1439 length:474 start_codon:yes stop_codon:yes gene_type:complete